MTEWIRDVLGITERHQRESERNELERDLAKIDFRMRLAVCGIKNKISTEAPAIHGQASGK